MLLPRGFPGRWIGALALVPLFVLFPPPPPPGAVAMTVLDVGQGLAVVVRTHSHALLYDAGPSYTPEADAGNRIVVPYLRAAGIRRLDAFVVSHEDNDHAGGAASVLAAVPVGWLASSLPSEHALHSMTPESTPCGEGQRWEWDGVRFEILHPPSCHEELRMRSNNRSCVLRIATEAKNILLTGDLEARGERALLARQDSIRTDVLVVPHHGSTTSSTLEFVAAAQPRIAVFSAGYRNRFGHPRAEVVERYVAVGARIVRSDWLGAIEFQLDGGGIRVAGWREVRRRYWQDPPEMR
jgi:competence protein ComEC